MEPFLTIEEKERGAGSEATGKAHLSIRHSNTILSRDRKDILIKIRREK